MWHSQLFSMESGVIALMKSDTRNKMVMGAIELIRQRGVNATSVREVVRHTDTPRGSIRYHFPEGKLQLVKEAIAMAGKEATQPLAFLMTEHGAIKGLGEFIDIWKNILEKSHFKSGCPILAVATEQYLGDDSNSNAEDEQQLLKLADDIFQEWQGIVAQALQKDGIETNRAQRLANLIISSVEGAIAMCRAAQTTQPLEDVKIELKLILHNVIHSN